MPTKPNFDRGSYTKESRDETTAEAKRKFEEERAKMGAVIFDASDLDKTKWRTKDFNSDAKTEIAKERAQDKATTASRDAQKLSSKIGDDGTTREEQQAGRTAETLDKVAEGTTTRDKKPEIKGDKPSGYETTAKDNIEAAAQAISYIPNLLDGGKYIKELYDSYFPEGISLNPQEFSVVDAQLPRQKFDTRKSPSITVSQPPKRLQQDLLPKYGGDMGTCPMPDYGECPVPESGGLSYGPVAEPEKEYFPTPVRPRIKAPQEADMIWRLKHGVKAKPKKVDTDEAYKRLVDIVKYTQAENNIMLSGNREAANQRNRHYSDIEAEKIIDASAPKTGGKKMIFPIGKLQRTAMQGAS